MISILMTSERLLWRVLQSLAGALLVGLMGLLALQILGRFFRLQTLIPADEIVNFFTVWFVFLSVALLVRGREHIRVDLLPTILARSPRASWVVDLTVELLVLAFTAVYFLSAVHVVQFSAMKMSPVYQFSEAFWFASLLVSAGLMAFYSLRRILLLALTPMHEQASKEE